MTRKLACVAAFAGGLTLAGCSLISTPQEAPRDDAGQVTEAAEADVTTLQVGDCTDEMADGNISESVLLPCGEPHYWEVFAATDLADGEFPADTEDQAFDYCGTEFEPFVGMDYDNSAYELFVMYPTAETWNLFDDREILCLVGTDAGGLTGTLRGIAG